MFLCSTCKNKTFLYKCLGSFIQKFFFLWHKQQLLFKKIYKYPFFFLFFCTNIFSIPPPHLITFNCTLSYLILRRELPPPSPVEHFVFTLSQRRQMMGWGGSPLMRSPCMGTAVAGRGGGSSSAPCTGKVGSSHSSPLPTGTGCAGWVVGGRAPSHSSSHWYSPWPSLP